MQAHAFGAQPVPTMRLILKALGRAIVSQLHPRMLWLAVWPFLAAALVWGVIGTLYSEEGLGALHRLLFENAVGSRVETVLHWVGLSAILIVPVLYVFLLIVLAIVTALLIIGLVVMPAVVGFVSERNYPQLARRGGGTSWGSLGNSLAALGVFLVGWVVTFPLWLFLPLAVLLPWFWLSWLNLRIMRYDALAQHASVEERARLYAEGRVGFWVMAAAAAGLNFVPLLFFVAPIFSGLLFTHYGLALLEDDRAAQGARAAAAAPAAPVPPSPTS